DFHVTGVQTCALPIFALSGGAALAAGKSKGQKAQERGTAQIPVCYKRLGTIAIVEPENRWWVSYELGSPEALIKTYVARSGCFGDRKSVVWGEGGELV